MAKSSSFFGLRKGSTKTLTFQVLNGKQITKDRVYTTTNPKTTGQMSQRACFATVTSAYRALSEICDHSFESASGKVTNQSEFVKRNVEIMRTRQGSFNPYGWKHAVPNPLVISDGTLSLSGKFKQNEFPEPNSVTIDGVSRLFIAQSVEGWDSLFSLTNDEFAKCTWKQFADLTGMKAGDQLTVLQLMADFNESYDLNTLGSIYGGIIYSSTLHLCRVIIPTTSEGLAKPAFAAITDEVGNFRFANYDSSSESVDSCIIDREQKKMGLLCPLGTSPKEATVYGGALIRSDYQNGKWRRSPAVLASYDGHYVDSMAMEYVLPTWNPTSEMYLNAASTRSMPTVWKK